MTVLLLSCSVAENEELSMQHYAVFTCRFKEVVSNYDYTASNDWIAEN
jgi:hypothetical protein